MVSLGVKRAFNHPRKLFRRVLFRPAPPPVPPKPQDHILSFKCLPARPRNGGLNFEVFVTIFSFLQDKRDVLAMMGTCRILYAAGTPALLSEVTLRSCSDIVSFSRTVFVDLPRRAYLIRHFHLLVPACRWNPCVTEKQGAIELWRNIQGEYVGPHAFLSRFIFKILSHAKQLETLNVKYLEDWLCANPQLTSVAQNLGKLHSFSLGVRPPIQDSLEDFVRHVPPQMTRLNLNFDDWLDTVPFLHIVPANIEHLSMDNGRPRFNDKPCPNVRVLTLTGWQTHNADLLAPAFPNLVELHCHSRPLRSPSGLRPENWTYFTEQAGDQWTSLRVLDGTTDDLYGLGYNRQVDVLDVDGKEDINMYHFSRLFNDAPPLCLRYTTNTMCLRQDREQYGISKEALKRVTELHVQLALHTFTNVPHKPSEDVEALLSFIQSFSSVVRLRLSITFSLQRDPISPEWPHTCAQRIANLSLPSLTCLALDMPDIPLSFWLIHHLKNQTGGSRKKRKKKSQPVPPQVSKLPLENGSQGWRLPVVPWSGHKLDKK